MPWRLIGASVRVQIAGGRVRIEYAGDEVALHGERTGLRRQRVVDFAHFEGVAGFRAPVRCEVASSKATAAPALLRPLVEYEELAGGSF